MNSLLAMHLPDGFMTPTLAVVGWILVLPALVWACSRDDGEHETTFAALLAAFLFAAQTFHFPVPGGTSGHFVGATLVVILCGPSLGLLVLTSVVVLQAFVFGDGGLFTMGWNLANMGLVGGVLGGALFEGLRRARISVSVGAFVAAWTATMMAAVCTAMELAAADLTPLHISLTAMLTVQSVVGIGEGLVTSGVVVFLLRTRPEFIDLKANAGMKPGVGVAALIGISTLLPPEIFGLASGRYPAAAVFVGLSAAVCFVVGLFYMWRRRCER